MKYDWKLSFYDKQGKQVGATIVKAEDYGVSPSSLIDSACTLFKEVSHFELNGVAVDEEEIRRRREAERQAAREQQKQRLSSSPN
jgi:hypothetical protein